MKKSTNSRTQSLSPVQKHNRRLILTVSVFLLAQEELKNQFWQVKSVEYDKTFQIVRVGVDTTTGKLGTTINKLRKFSKDLSGYLFENGLTFRHAKVAFFVDKEEADLQRIYSILEGVQ